SGGAGRGDPRLLDGIPLPQRGRRHHPDRRRPAGDRRARRRGCGARARRDRPLRLGGRLMTSVEKRAAGEKRPAFEIPAELAKPPVVDVRMRRPVATAAGAALVLLRVLAGVVWLVSLALQWPD